MYVEIDVQLTKRVQRDSHLVNEGLVIRLHLLHIDPHFALAIEVIFAAHCHYSNNFLVLLKLILYTCAGTERERGDLLEDPKPLEHLLVLIIHEIGVSSGMVQGVEGMEPHDKGRYRW